MIRRGKNKDTNPHKRYCLVFKEIVTAENQLYYV